MNIAVVFGILAVPLAACIISRMMMFRAYTQQGMNAQAIKALLIPGVCLDMAVLLIPFLLVYGAAYFLPVDGPLPTLCAFILMLLCSCVLILTVADVVIYQTAQIRFTPIVLKEMRIRNFSSFTSKKQLFYLIILFLVISSYIFLGVVSIHFTEKILSIIATLAIASLLFFNIYKKHTVDGTRYFIFSSIGKSSYVTNLIQDRIRCIKKSCCINFFQCIVALFRDKKIIQKADLNYTTTELRMLNRFNLLEQPHYSANAITPYPYSRIICIFLESIGQKLLPFYNSAIPPETTPFLQSVFANYPRLDSLYTSNTPTAQGLYAVHASRLTYERDLADIMNGVDTLPVLLREKGFQSYALCGVTRHYGDHHRFFTRLLRYDTYLAEEDLRQRCPTASACGWGLADNYLYACGLQILEQHKNSPILLTLETMNTHPHFFYTLSEKHFPASIQNSRSRLLRSLYEMDTDLRLFFMALGKKGLLDEQTLIMISADHSPSHGLEVQHVAKVDTFFPDMIPCVFITKTPQESPFASLRPDILCSQLDLLPTLIEALGLRRTSSILGHSLFSGQNTTVVTKDTHTMRLKTTAADFLINLDLNGKALQERGFTKWYYRGVDYMA